MNKRIDFKVLRKMIYDYFYAVANNIEYDSGIHKNIVLLCGIIKALPQYSHSVLGESFYKTVVAVPRRSGAEDNIPVLISEKFFDMSCLSLGQVISLVGQFRSYNRISQEGKLKLELVVHAREVELVEDGQHFAFENTVLLDGYICKKPVHRFTPFGKEITDIILAVNRKYFKSDYIPLVIWSRNAAYTANLPIGDRLVVVGRLESREYTKILESGEAQKRTAYEVSVSGVIATGENTGKPERKDSSGSVA